MSVHVAPAPVISYSYDATGPALDHLGPLWQSDGSDRGEDDFVVKELRLGVDGAPIVPVLIDGAEMPGGLKLPADLATLYLVHALEMRSLRHSLETEARDDGRAGRRGCLP